MHWETDQQKRARCLEIITELGGKIKERNRVTGVFFDGPTDAPGNSLFIPLSDFGYSKEHGVFRKSIRPNYESEVTWG